MSELVPCPSCARHVRAAATVCPFCSAALDASVQPSVVRGPRLGRAQLVGVGAVLGAATVTWAVAATTCAVYGGPPVELHPTEVDDAGGVSPGD